MKLTFDDVLIRPEFSRIKSRKDVDLSSNTLGLKLPIVSSNMKTVTESFMADKMNSQGAVGALHRFWDIDTNLKEFNACGKNAWISIGLGDYEKERADTLISNGAETIIIDVANGAQMEVVNQTIYLREKYKDNIRIIVGNFANSRSISDFDLEFQTKTVFLKTPDFYKVGIGNGANCITRIVTGVGYPQLSAILECSHIRPGKIIADGGCKTVGDIAKSLAAGAEAVMLGSMLAGTTESPGELIYQDNQAFKMHNGSASEGYGEGWKTSEGVKSLIPFKGSVIPILKDIEGGLRSSFTYTNSKTLTEFQNNAKLIEVSSNTVIENHPHIKGSILK